MTYTRQCSSEAMILVLLVGAPLIMANTMSTEPPVSSSDNSSSNDAMNEVMMKFLPPIAALECIAEYVNMSAFSAKWQQITASRDFNKTKIKLIMEELCGMLNSDQLLNCLETKIRSSNHEIDKVLAKMVDFQKVRSLTKYNCDTIDTIFDNFDCLLNHIMAIGNATSDYQTCVVSSMNTVVQSAQTKKQTVEQLVRMYHRGASGMIDCGKDIYKGCGEAEAVYKHMANEFALLIRDENNDNSATKFADHHLLIAVSAMLTSVLLRERF